MLGWAPMDAEPSEPIRLAPSLSRDALSADADSTITSSCFLLFRLPWSGVWWLFKSFGCPLPLTDSCVVRISGRGQPKLALVATSTPPSKDRLICVQFGKPVLCGLSNCFG